MADITIKTVQFKRGLEANLIAKLKSEGPGVLGVLLAGEPAYATDTHVLKIGDGIRDYEDLPSISGSGSGQDERFVIQDPLDGQVLLYDNTLDKWVNKDLADEDSIIYLANHGLTLKGYDQASQGQMLVKDSIVGLAWVTPISDTQLRQYVDAASASASAAGQSATLAGNAQSAAETAQTAAETAAGNASRINQQTMNFVNNKFW